jgi:hypothetical protein
MDTELDIPNDGDEGEVKLTVGIHRETLND